MNEDDISWKEFLAWLVIGVHKIFKKIIGFLFGTGILVFLFYLFSNPKILLYLLVFFVVMGVLISWQEVVIWAKRKLGKHPFESV